VSADIQPIAAPLGHHWDTPRKSMGAASELRAAAHLLAQGYDVYRSVAPHAGFDLVAYRGDVPTRVEVKTLGQPKNPAHTPPFGWPADPDAWDLLLIVGPDVVIQLPHGSTRDQAIAAIRKHFQLLATPDELSVRERVAALVESSPAQLWTAAVVAFELGITRPAATDALIALDAGGSVERVGRGSYRLVR
jgi:hypothetical protein